MQLTYQNKSPYNVYASALRMLNFMEGRELDEPLTRWKAELEEAIEALIDNICDRTKKIGMKDQVNAMLKCIVGIRLLVKSCIGMGNATLEEHAKAVERVLNEYVGFRHMRIGSKMTNAELLLRDLRTPQMLPHVEAIPELAERLSLLEQARENVANRRFEMLCAEVEAKNKPHLQPLKRNIAQIMNNIGEYLKAMMLIEANAETYEPLLKMFQLIIKEQNKKRKRASRSRQKDTQAKDDGTLTVEMKQSTETEA